MRAWILAATVAFSAALAAPEPPPDTREKVRVTLEDGQVVEGRVVQWKLEEVVVDVGIGVDLTVRQSQVERVPQLEPKGRPLYRVRRTDGRTFHGYLVAQDRERLVLDHPRGWRLVIPQRSVRELVEIRNPTPELWADESLEPDPPEPELIARAPPPQPPPAIAPPPPPPPPAPEPEPEPEVIAVVPAPAPPPREERAEVEEAPPLPEEEPAVAWQDEDLELEEARERKPVKTEVAKPKKRKVVAKKEEPPGPDPHRTRYFFAPSAWTLEPGEGYVSQKEVIYTHLALGLTPTLQLEVGSVVPIWLAGWYGLNLTLGVKNTFPLRENLRIAASVYTLIVPAGSVGLTVPTVTMTTGTPDLHASISASVPIAVFGSGVLPTAVFNLSGSARVGRGFSLLTENYFIFQTNFQTVTVLSAGFRVFGDPLSMDLALVAFNPGARYGALLLPYLDFTVRWH